MDKQIGKILQTQKTLLNLIGATNDRIDELWRSVVDLKMQIEANKTTNIPIFGFTVTSTIPRPQIPPLSEKEVEDIKKALKDLDSFDSLKEE